MGGGRVGVCMMCRGIALVGLVWLAMGEPVWGEERWQAVLGNYCLDCHDGDSEKGGLNLEALLDVEMAPHADEW
jgi:hypothetical protein